MSEMATLFTAIMEYAEAKGVSKINALPGCWEVQVDEQWWFAVNGQKLPVTCSHGVEIEPFHCFVEYNGWPAGIFTPYGGEFAAGSAANEETFEAALKAARVLP